MKLSKLFQGWSINFVWEWSHWSKTIYLTPCHIGLEAGTYVGSYIELSVVILGVGFNCRWYPPTESKDEFLKEMDEAIASARKEYGLTEDAT